MNFKKVTFTLIILILFSSCSRENKEADVAKAPKPYKVSKDLKAIKEDGVLHAISIYNSTSYFLYRGMPIGFEYELLSRLAKDLDLELKITIAKDIDDLFDMLNNGEGDLVA